VTNESHRARVFKSAWFSKAARKARISDDKLCEAIGQVMKGQADDPGGGVFKKRVNKNMHRGIILAKFLPRPDSIGFTSICSPRRTATLSTTMSWRHFGSLPSDMRSSPRRRPAAIVRNGAFTEICNDSETQI